VLLSEVYQIADEIAPKALSDEMCAKYGFYDNSGLLVEAGENVHSILFSLDFSEGAVARAIEEKVDLIITHHPAIYGKIGDICLDNPLGKKLVRCLQNGISVISMHLNLDAAKGGTDESLRDGILHVCSKMTGAGTSLNTNSLNETCQVLLMQGAYGRVYNVPEITENALVEGLREEFKTSRVLLYGTGERKINRVASFCGAGSDESALAFAKREGAQAIVSSDFRHHILTSAVEMGMAVIVLTHYASENYGFKKYYEKIRGQIEIPCEYHTDENLL
jgi:dinuclear metal center YbgI/SA1388 family protein